MSDETSTDSVAVIRLSDTSDSTIIRNIAIIHTNFVKTSTSHLKSFFQIGKLPENTHVEKKKY